MYFPTCHTRAAKLGMQRLINFKKKKAKSLLKKNDLNRCPLKRFKFKK